LPSDNQTRYQDEDQSIYARKSLTPNIRTKRDLIKEYNQRAGQDYFNVKQPEPMNKSLSDLHYKSGSYTAQN
jgi:hypothetical protein